MPVKISGFSLCANPYVSQKSAKKKNADQDTSETPSAWRMLQTDQACGRMKSGFKMATNNMNLSKIRTNAPLLVLIAPVRLK